MGKWTETIRLLNLKRFSSDEGSDSFQNQVNKAKGKIQRSFRRCVDCNALFFLNEESPVVCPTCGGKNIENADLTPQDLARLVRDVKTHKEDKEAELKNIELELEAGKQLLIDSYESEGLTGLKLEEGGSVNIQDDIAVRTTDHEVVRTWFKEEGMEEMLRPNPATLLAVVKKQLESKKPTPPGVALGVRTQVKVLKK